MKKLLSTNFLMSIHRIEYSLKLLGVLISCILLVVSSLNAQTSIRVETNGYHNLVPVPW